MGGLGTRLLTYTKNNPKTMLPLYEKGKDKHGDLVLRPLIEIIFENLYDRGFRRFCFIVGSKTKHSIIEHMEPDEDYISLLKKRNKSEDKRFIQTLSRISKKINKSEIKWISQDTPMGFGDALSSSRKFVGKETFLLHAGDAYIPNYEFLSDFIKIEKIQKCSGVLLLQRKKDLRGYGIAQLKKKNNEKLVINVQEKPKKPLSSLVILPIYIFKPSIFDALEKTAKGYNCELQVTDAIQKLIDWDKKIVGYDYSNKPWYDIGTPANYFKSLVHSFKIATK
jgi:UTP--glucose-1-phosphate uridylyltransferase